MQSGLKTQQGDPQSDNLGVARTQSLIKGISKEDEEEDCLDPPQLLDPDGDFSGAVPHLNVEDPDIAYSKHGYFFQRLSIS